MKRDLEHLDLKQAFHPVPEACRRALMDAARSVREEKPVKRVSYRAALIAAVILLAARRSTPTIPMCMNPSVPSAIPLPAAIRSPTTP